MPIVGGGEQRRRRTSKSDQLYATQTWASNRGLASKPNFTKLPGDDQQDQRKDPMNLDLTLSLWVRSLLEAEKPLVPAGATVLPATGRIPGAGVRQGTSPRGEEEVLSP